jgi:hypothetical protein
MGGRCSHGRQAASAIVFLSATLVNFGSSLPLGVATIGFESPIWRAGIGEAVIARDVQVCS